MNITEKIADIIVSELKDIEKGKNIFLGKSADMSDNDVIMLSEEVSLTQPEIFNGTRSKWEQTNITARVIWGASYISSQEQSKKIYDIFRNNTSFKSRDIISINATKPSLIQKVKDRFKFIFTISVIYLI